MFTVNYEYLYNKNYKYTFQNISCLRLIKDVTEEMLKHIVFQNISCLRLIAKSITFKKVYDVFQNISCLRLMYRWN